MVGKKLVRKALNNNQKINNQSNSLKNKFILKNKSEIKLIMFDYDGTIMDTFLLSCHVYNRIFKEFNIEKEFTKRQFQELFETDWREALKKLNLITKEQWDRCGEIYNEHTADYEDDFRCYPHIEEILEQLHKKYILAIVSNGNKKNIASKLKKCNLLQYFDYISGYEQGEKPSPKPLLKCMNKLNIKPEQSIYIGDMDGDIVAGKAAKVNTVIAVTYGYHHHTRLQDADVIIHKPEELLNIFM